MKVDAQQIIELRRSRSWSQEELAIAAGLNRRTVQRIERQATASLQSLKAMAAAFDVDSDDLRIEARVMPMYEYKTVELSFKFGVFKQGTPDIDAALNAEAEEGWRLCQMVLPASSNFGQSEKMVAILERIKAG